MSSFPYLTVTMAIPLAGTGVIALLPAAHSPALAKRIAFITSLVVLVMSIVDAVKFTAGGPRFQLTESYKWIPQFHIDYAVGVDGVALVLILLATILMPLVILASWHDAEESEGHRSPRTYFGLLLVLETMMVGVFAATDIFLFYVIFEVMLIPMYFLIGAYGGARRSYAAVKFLLYGLLGGLLMLAAVIGFYVVAARSSVGGTFDFQTLSAAVAHGTIKMSPVTERWLFLGFFVAFAIKAPMVPFHSWLPDASGEATPGTAVLLVGVLDKVGTFGMLRYCLELFPNASHYFTPVIVVFAVISTIYGALLAIGQTDLKRLIGYTSISHFGLIVLGVFALNQRGQVGATLYMVNHGLSTGALFIIAGFMIRRSQKAGRVSSAIEHFGGVQKVAPVLAGTFLVAGLSSLALPGLSSFVSEFLVLVGSFERWPVAAIISITSIVLAAIYILWLYQRTMTGPVVKAVEGFKDLSLREVVAVVPLLALIIALGFFPKIATDYINPAINSTPAISSLHSTPPPAMAQSASSPSTGQSSNGAGQ
jgi:NADH-quinone oxidoreductase subunit M